MYYFDPVLGNRRRSLFRDQMVHSFIKTCHGLDASWRDMQHRMYGTFAEARARVRGDEADDEVVCDRVRAKIGRYVSHPSSIEVSAHDGDVALRGPVLAPEVENLISAVESVRGVNKVTNNLDVYKEPGNIAGLQGGGSRRGEPAELMQTYWSPTTRVAVGTLGGMLLLNGLTRRTPSAALLGIAGLLAGTRALTNLETKRLFGVRGRRGVDIQKTVTIDRPVEEVFNFLTEPENYPRITDLIRSAKKLEDGRIQKTIVGPGGAEITVTERITASEPNHFIAKRSEPDSPLRYAMRAWFIPQGESRTTVQIQAKYNPPGGVFSHAAALVTGVDPKTLLDDFMVRAKSYLETGVQPHDASQKEAAKV
jgi:uncharacterized membrane protein